MIKEYQARKEHYGNLHQNYAKTSNYLSNLRLLVIVLGVIGAAALYIYGSPGVSFGVLSISVVLFIILIVKHQSYDSKKEYAAILKQINESSIQRAEGKWNSFLDTGVEFLDDKHPYAFDLNIFGQGSLFQWINTATTYVGRDTLAHLLTNPCEDENQIKDRQDTILELRDKLDWKQRFLSKGIVMDKNKIDPSPLITWTKDRSRIFGRTLIAVGVKVLPIITIFLILSSIFTGLSYYLPVSLIAVQACLLMPNYKKRAQQFAVVDSYLTTLKSYQRMLEVIEQEQFDSSILCNLQKKLINSSNKKASHQLQELEKIVDNISHRHGQLYIFFNILFWLDFRWLISLERWKEKSGDLLDDWFSTIGYFDALISLSNIADDHSDWVIPEITEEKTYEADNAGHPLITSGRVCNDIKIIPPDGVLLITGSNMSGKSTLLRTVGINLVLAYMGTPVCADRLKTSVMKLYTCMNINDNLEENLSSFYAELLRIKNIVKIQEQGIPVFFLLDEIFKGTNSRDRHVGAKAVIKKLYQEGAMGLVSTHDLELGALADEQRGVENYHFREFFQQGEISFDYKLRSGLSPTRNAVYLMKLAGIDIESIHKKDL